MVKQSTAFFLLFIFSVSTYANESEDRSTNNTQAHIQFHVIENSPNKHLSIIPSAGYNRQGNIIETYDPNSIIYQHAALLDNLKNEQAELDRKAEEEALAELAKLKEENKNTETFSLEKQVENTRSNNIFYDDKPKERRPILEELILLEKRGGKRGLIEKEQ